jgi:hypothetical protein
MASKVCVGWRGEWRNGGGEAEKGGSLMWVRRGGEAWMRSVG